MLALAIVLLLGLGEPLACIIHCQIWLPFVSHSYLAAHLHHHHHISSGSSATAQPSAPAPSCDLYVGHSDSAPFHIPPSPVHEMLLAFGPPLLLVILLFVYLIVPPGPSPNRSIPPPLRPPITFAV